MLSIQHYAYHILNNLLILTTIMYFSYQSMILVNVDKANTASTIFRITLLVYERFRDQRAMHATFETIS